MATKIPGARVIGGGRTVSGREWHEQPMRPLAKGGSTGKPDCGEPAAAEIALGIT